MKTPIIAGMLFLLIHIPFLMADDPPLLQEIDEHITLSAETSSGTPLILEFFLEDPKEYVKQLNFDFHVTGVVDYSVKLPLERDDEDKPPVYKGIPFRAPGMVHQLTVELVTPYGSVYRMFEVAFAEYLWGRDNLSFANDNVFRRNSGAISDYLFDWAQDQLGELDDEQEFLVTSLMYRLFRGNIGRCYGFSAGGLYYMEHPEILSEAYGNAFRLDEDDPEVVELIHRVQNDIVYFLFSTGEVSPELDNDEPQDIKQKFHQIAGYIHRDKPVVLGYVSERTHHSMVAYGYIRHLHDDRIVLTMANNWNRDQKNNLYSDDSAEVVISRNDDSYSLRWLHHSHRPENRLFVIDPRRRYDPDPDLLMRMLEEERGIIARDGIFRIIIEHPGWAYVKNDEGAIRGYDGDRHYWGMRHIHYRRFDDIYIFDIPADQNLKIYVGGPADEDDEPFSAEAHVYFAYQHDGGFTVLSRRSLHLGQGEEKEFVLEKVE